MTEVQTGILAALVKRTAQASFEPEAFMLRRSMPWADGLRCGLMFVAFGQSFDSGAYFWRAPMRDGRLDLRVLGP